MSEFDYAIQTNADLWVPGCGGTEKPFTVKGYRLLYCYNPALRTHGYLDLSRDVILTDDEVRNILP